MLIHVRKRIFLPVAFFRLPLPEYFHSSADPALEFFDRYGVQVPTIGVTFALKRNGIFCQEQFPSGWYGSFAVHLVVEDVLEF